MLYKTIVLDLLKQHSQIHDKLCHDRTLLPTLNLLAGQLKTSHEFWKDRFAHGNPASEASQIASESLEIALKELEVRLLAASPPDDNEQLSLEDAMTFLRRPTPTG